MIRTSRWIFQYSRFVLQMVGGRGPPVNGGHRVNCANLRTFLRSFALEILEMSPMAFRLLIYVVGPRSAEMHSLMHFPSRESL